MNPHSTPNPASNQHLHEDALVLVWYPPHGAEEQARDKWAWLPGTILTQCGPDKWHVLIEVPNLAEPDPTIANGDAPENLLYPTCHRDATELRAVSISEWDEAYRECANALGPHPDHHGPSRDPRRARRRSHLVPPRLRAGAHSRRVRNNRQVPITVDGLIWAASMVILDASRRKQRVPLLAKWSLGVGIAATIGANVAHGLNHGPIGALVSAWPALALVGSFELLMTLTRNATWRAPMTCCAVW